MRDPSIDRSDAGKPPRRAQVKRYQAHPAQRYTAVAIVLHWAIAAAIIGNLLLGWWMQGAIEIQQSQARAIAAFQLHKSIGLTILVLSVFRLVWRWLHQPPPLPVGMPAWERFAAKATHWILYALMIGIPLSGWLYVSTQWRGQAPLNIPTLWFGLFEIPHLFGLNDATRQLRETLAGVTLDAHVFLGWGAVALLVLHVAAALKHHLVDRDEVLGHMIPALQVRAEAAPVPQDRRRAAILAGGFAAIAIAAIFTTITLVRTPSGAGESSDEALSNQGAAASEAHATRPAIRSAKGGWVIDPGRSEIAFSGVHAGVAFRGRFTRWSADIRLDPADVAQSHIAATIETASATDGVPLHDETLPQGEWFDTANHPVATYRITSIGQGDGHRYEIDGVLTIKRQDLVLSPLTLEIDGDRATLSGRVKIDRRDADLGMESDPDAAWVSREIIVDVRVTAARESSE